MRRRLWLNKPSEFRKVFKKGKKAVSPHFILYTYENGLGYSRLGIAIAKVHFKLATRRNRLRRVAKAVFKEKIYPECNDYDFVLASKARFQSPDISTATKELKEFLLRIKP